MLHITTWTVEKYGLSTPVHGKCYMMRLGPFNFQLYVPLALVIIDRFTNTAVRSRANEFCDLAAEIRRQMKALEYC